MAFIALASVSMIAPTIAQAADHVAALSQPKSPTYTLTDLGPLPAGYPSYPLIQGVDDRGDVVAQLCCNVDPQPAGTPAVMFHDGVVSLLGRLPTYPATNVTAINGSGYAVGQATRFGFPLNVPPHSRAIAFSHGHVMDLGVLPHATESGAAGVNKRGDAIGYSTMAGNQPTVTLFLHGRVLALGPGYASSINDQDIAIGTSLGSQATLFTLSGMVPLGTLGGMHAWSTGVAVNNSGVAIGYAGYQIPRNPGYVQHAFAYFAHRMLDIGFPAGIDPLTTMSAARAINNDGDIVGFYARSSGGPAHGFLFTRGRMLDLTSLVVASAGWVVDNAAAINDCGDIAGTGVRNGQTRAILLRPTNENEGTSRAGGCR